MIRYLHLRKHLNNNPKYEVILKGGKTIAYHVEGDRLFYSVAVTGKKENYNRRRGAMIAGGRLLCIRESAQHHKHMIVLEENAKIIETLIALEGAGYVQNAGT
jgi:hypothetical protein